jgi:hypothetical protein
MTSAQPQPGGTPATCRPCVASRPTRGSSTTSCTSGSTVPDAPGEPLHSVGRPDIVSLHSAAGGRAITWHDPDVQVVWLLGFTPEHDCCLFERRAAAGQLLPDEQDEVQLELERERRDFESQIRPGLEQLLHQAIAHRRYHSEAPSAVCSDWRCRRSSCLPVTVCSGPLACRPPAARADCCRRPWLARPEPARDPRGDPRSRRPRLPHRAPRRERLEIG